MRPMTPFTFVLALGLVLPLSLGLAQSQGTSAADPRARQIQSLLDSAVGQTLAKFTDRPLKPEQLAVTLVDLRDPHRPVPASYRGAAQIYPASVVKLF